MLGTIDFLDDDAHSVVPAGGNQPAFRIGGTSPWVTEEAIVPVPNGAMRAVLQFEKTHATGTIQIDDVIVLGNPQPDATDWKPYHIETKKTDWLPVQASKAIKSGTVLDASALLESPAGGHGFVTVKNGRLTFQDGKRARFFGVELLAPTAFQELILRVWSIAWANWMNLIRLGDLDTARLVRVEACSTTCVTTQRNSIRSRWQSLNI